MASTDENRVAEERVLYGCVRIETADTQAVQKNAALNGRLFISLLFVANLVAFTIGHGPRHWVLAILSSVVVGISYVCDLVATMLLRKALYALAVALSVAVTVLTLLSIH